MIGVIMDNSNLSVMLLVVVVGVVMVNTFVVDGGGGGGVLPLFVRFDDDADAYSIDVPSDATVGDLHEIIKGVRHFDDAQSRLEMSVSGTLLGVMADPLADSGVCAECVVSARIIALTDTQLMQKFLMRTNAREVNEEVNRYWDTDCCRWSGEVIRVTCDNESGRVIRLQISSPGFIGSFAYRSLPSSLQELYISRHADDEQSLRFHDLSHLHHLELLTLFRIPIDPQSQLHELPRSLETIKVEGSKSPHGRMHWDFTRLTTFLPNLVTLWVLNSHFDGILDFGDSVPQSLHYINLQACDFQARGANLSALMRSDCNVNYLDFSYMRTPGFREDIQPLIQQLARCGRQIALMS